MSKAPVRLLATLAIAAATLGLGTAGAAPARSGTAATVASQPAPTSTPAYQGWEPQERTEAVTRPPASVLASDPTGDVDPSAQNNADLTSTGVVWDTPGTVTFSNRVVTGTNPNSWNSDSGSFWFIGDAISPNYLAGYVNVPNQGITAFVAPYDANSGTVGAATCLPQHGLFASYDGAGTYRLRMPIGCIGSPPEVFWVGVFDWSNGSTIWEDVAPADGQFPAGPAGPPGPFWNGESLDSNGDTGVGSDALQYGSQLHVFEYNSSGGNLKHLFWDGNGWQTEVLDGAGGANGRQDANVGLYPTALVWGVTVHVWYQNVDDGDLRHGWWDGTKWNFETLDGAGAAAGMPDRTANNVGNFNSSVLFGTPHVWTYDATDGNLRHNWWDGSAWRAEVLDGTGGGLGRIDKNTGLYTSVLIFAGTPHVFTYDFEDGFLRHNWWNGAVWQAENLDGAGGSFGQTSNDVGAWTSVVEYNGGPHVFYQSLQGRLRHAWWNGSAWSAEQLDGIAMPGVQGSIPAALGSYTSTMLFNGTPHVFYYDEDHGDLRHAWWGGFIWGAETLDGDGGVGIAGGPNGQLDDDEGLWTTSIVYNGQPHVFQYDVTTGELRHDWYG